MELNQSSTYNAMVSSYMFVFIEANVLTLVVGDKRVNISIYIFQLSIWGDRGYSPIQTH